MINWIEILCVFTKKIVTALVFCKMLMMRVLKDGPVLNRPGL